MDVTLQSSRFGHDPLAFYEHVPGDQTKYMWEPCNYHVLGKPQESENGCTIRQEAQQLMVNWDGFKAQQQDSWNE